MCYIKLCACARATSVHAYTRVFERPVARERGTHARPRILYVPPLIPSRTRPPRVRAHTFSAPSRENTVCAHRLRAYARIRCVIGGRKHNRKTTNDDEINQFKRRSRTVRAERIARAVPRAYRYPRCLHARAIARPSRARASSSPSSSRVRMRQTSLCARATHARERARDGLRRPATRRTRGFIHHERVRVRRVRVWVSRRVVSGDARALRERMRRGYRRHWAGVGGISSKPRALDDDASDQGGTLGSSARARA